MKWADDFPENFVVYSTLNENQYYLNYFPSIRNKNAMQLTASNLTFDIKKKILKVQTV